ncbi:MAG: magnesium transporter CorA family protein [Janthinobacterium lividum]
MLTVHPGGAPARVLPAPQAGPAAGVWLDLFDGTDAERALAAELTGLRVPAREEIAEIETSSRLQRAGDTLYLSTSIVARPDDGGPLLVTPLGLVLSPRHLLTVRYSRLAAFDGFARALAAGSPDPVGPEGGGAASSTDAFLGLLEAMVDRAADILEHAGAELDSLSATIFHAETRPGRGGRSDATLRAVLRRIGQAGDLVSHLRDSLLGLGRISAFVAEAHMPWMPPDLHGRCVSVRADIASLADHDAQLTNKVQFLLDATLGFLNIEQNNGIKVLTVVSLIGIPPTLIASIYGMNFKNMPELDWTYGYPYALCLIVFSVVGPLALFRWRGWL